MLRYVVFVSWTTQHFTPKAGLFSNGFVVVSGKALLLLLRERGLDTTLIFWQSRLQVNGSGLN